MGIVQHFWFLLWRIRDGDNTLRYRYPLTRKSVVWDVGGYVGEWSEVINERYHPQIVIFEPIKKYGKVLRARFSDAPNVSVRNYGLSNRNRKVFFSAGGLSSSQYKKGKEPALLKDVASQIHKVDLMKINIEGGEYDVLARLIETGKINDIQYLQIQFHDFVPHARSRRKEIIRKLRKTHRRTFFYLWTWEGWERR